MKEERDMSANTPATAQGETATDELSTSRGRRRKLITALMILAFLAMKAIALYALSLIAGAVILLLVSALLAYIINLIVVITLSVYFVVDGPRILGWLRLKTPVTRRDTINFLLHALDQSLGGYLRGTLLIALLGALATGVGLALLHVPYAALLGTLFFFLYFVPVIGAYVIGALCILAALSQGWVVTLTVAVYITLLQSIVIGQILSPRIFSKTVGVHPIVAIFALFAGAELFGLLGGLLAVPVAGVLQQILVALWHRWKQEHPEQFPPEEPPLQPSAQLPEQQVLPFRAAERS